MSELTPLKKWSLIFKERPDKANVNGTPTEESAEGDADPGKIIQEPEVYYQRLAAASSGFYPISLHGVWHGGIHFDQSSGLKWTMSIYNLADGEVVATRINDSYVKVSQDESPVCLSSGFALIRHRLELPPEPPAAKEVPASEAAPDAAATPDMSATPPDTAPTPQGETRPPAGGPATPPAQPPSETPSTEPATAPASSEQTAPPPPRPALTFYSLYMHMLPWKAHSQQGVTLPQFWGASQYQIKADKKTDKLLGVRIRPTAGTTNKIDSKKVLSVVVRGSVLRLGEELASNKKYRKVEEIISGKAYPEWDGTTEGYSYVPELIAVEGQTNHWFVGEKAKDAPEDTTAKAIKGQYIRETAANGSKILALLLPDKKVKLGEVSGIRSKITALESADSTIPPLQADADGNLPGWVASSNMSIVSTEPEKLDEIQFQEPPAVIKAGEIVGYPGTQNIVKSGENQYTGEPVLHLEVFSADDVPAFVAQSRNLADKLADNQKTLLKVDVGTQLAQPSATDTEIPAGADVALEADSPKDGRWAKAKAGYVIEVDKKDLGKYNSGQYALDATQKNGLATKAGLSEAAKAKMPSSVFFVKKLDGEQRVVSFSLSDAEACWIPRDQLNEEGRRSSTEAALPAWKAFPLKEAATDSPTVAFMRLLPLSQIKKEDKATDGQTVWWSVSAGNEQGEDIQGWVKEGGTVVRCSPWHWPGFEFIEEQSKPADQAAAKEVNQAEGESSADADPQRIGNLRIRADQADRGELLQKLHEIIDSQGTKDGQLTVDEYQKALAKPWLAEQMSRLVVKYESEWYADEGLSKWEELFKVIDPQDQQSQHWDVMRNKIKALIWYKDVAGKVGLPEDGKVWHFHPVGLVGAMGRIGDWFDIEEFITKYKEMHSVIFGFYDGDTKIKISSLNKKSEDSLRTLLNEMKNQYYNYFDIFNEKFISYMLSTIRIESYDFTNGVYFKPINEIISYEKAEREYGSGSTATDKKRRRAILNHNTNVGDGYKYRGRGLVQLTWKINYKKFMRLTGIDIVTNPDLCLEINTAVSIMMKGMRDGSFREDHTLERYLGEGKSDYFNARLIINGYRDGIPDRANHFEDYAMLFEKIIKEVM
ncbi:hypothetical protein [Pragia fontium]|uniref:Glycoside hydrolase family 19 catalytic domain-containing protein n=1 Tax=Pragia fontium DSM 5563 = ATCC 49100 TaxID=1122977 RepID=A0AAJ4WBR7_9GAMM|nr:hypothetical protein [Pragia fontium]SFD05273.1 hypothetical protein SAMN02745723_10789 [Pragia fontium DSM 5563 = ATCC 49100]